MANLENLDYQDWAPGPNPMDAVYPSMSEEDIAMGPAAAYGAWQKDIADHIRVGCVLRMANGDFVLIGNATVSGWEYGEAYEARGSDSNESWRTADITGIAYPFEDEIAPESYQEPEDEWYDDMDGDHKSALASAGFGTDEDYGHYGGDEDY